MRLISRHYGFVRTLRCLINDKYETERVSGICAHSTFNVLFPLLQMFDVRPTHYRDLLCEDCIGLSLKEDERYYRTVRGSAGSISANAISLITMRVL